MIVQAFRVQAVDSNKQKKYFPTYFIVYRIYFSQVFASLMHRRGFSKIKCSHFYRNSKEHASLSNLTKNVFKKLILHL